MDRFDPNAPETEGDGIRAEALRRLRVRRLLKEPQTQAPGSLPLQSSTAKSAGSLIKNDSGQQSSLAPDVSALPPSNEINPVERKMDLLPECISDLNSQLQEWLGFDIPTEGTEDYEMWQMKISLIEQVECISDVYELCEGGDFNLPSVLEDEADE